MNRTSFAVLLCAVVLCATLVAGLTPFRRPPNAVTWFGAEDGLRFGRHGTLWSDGEFHATAARDESAECSLEIWAQPALASAASTILAFYNPENPVQFSVYQYHALLILKRENADDPRSLQVIGITDALHAGKTIFVTVTSGSRGTSIYVDGILVRAFPEFRMADDCAGRLVIGTSAVRPDSWKGILRGAAIYGRELTAAEVLEHYATWTTRGRPAISADENAVGVYLFGERAGSVVHDSEHRGIDLYIPKRFSLLHEQFLKPFWREFKPTRSYALDVLVNIAGFIPLGFVFFAYWSSVRPIKRPALATVALGLVVSLTIEVLQSYIPTRDSGTTDLITNTLGTFVGVRLCAAKTARSLLAKIY